MLLSGRTDVAIMNKSIFRFYKNKLISEGKVSAKVAVVLDNLFEPTRYRTAFIDHHIRDAFNQGLKILRESGRYDEIYENYIDKYFEIPRKKTGIINLIKSILFPENCLKLSLPSTLA